MKRFASLERHTHMSDERGENGEREHWAWWLVELVFDFLSELI